MYVEHNKPNWDKLQAVSVLTSDSPKLGPALKKNPYRSEQHHKGSKQVICVHDTTYNDTTANKQQVYW